MPARLFVSPPNYSLAPPNQVEFFFSFFFFLFFFFFFFFFFPFFRFNLNRCRTMARPSHARRPLCCPRPSCLVVPMHWSSVRSTHTLHAHPLTLLLPPGSTTRWVFLFY